MVLQVAHESGKVRRLVGRTSAVAKKLGVEESPFLRTLDVMSSAEDAWMGWLTEATAVVSAWEIGRRGPMLTLTDAAALTDCVARKLADVYQRGLQDG